MNLETAMKVYESLGFHRTGEVEILRVLKMRDDSGNTIELVQGNWHPHIAVNWYADGQGNYIEVVEERK